MASGQRTFRLGSRRVERQYSDSEFLEPDAGWANRRLSRSHGAGARAGRTSLARAREGAKPNYDDGVRGTKLRSFAVAVAFSLGIATVALAGASPTTSAPTASTAAALGTGRIGIDAAILLAELDRPADRVTHRRSTALKWALALVGLLSSAVLGAGLARWFTPSSEVAARSRVLPRRAPQRAPPFLPLALS